MVLTTIGLLAGFLTAACWLPQLRRRGSPARRWTSRGSTYARWRAASVSGSSTACSNGDVPLALANGATGAALITLICFKARFDRERRRTPRVAAVLLDMDGTLVDSDAAVERAWTRWAARVRRRPRLVSPLMHGGTSHTTVRTLAPHWSDEQVQEAGDRQLALQYDDLGDVVRARGADVLLRYLDEHDVPWAVVTSADRKLATRPTARRGHQAAAARHRRRTS